MGAFAGRRKLDVFGRQTWLLSVSLDKRIADSGKAANHGPDDDDGTPGTLGKTG
jgi:hypothetical protein